MALDGKLIEVPVPLNPFSRRALVFTIIFGESPLVGE
jgi:hypothetical protein